MSECTNAEKRYTEQEVIVRERTAFRSGAGWRFDRALELDDGRFTTDKNLLDSEYQTEALRRFPDPTPEPTVVMGENGWEYRYALDGQFQVRMNARERWHECHQCDLPQRITPSFAASLGEIAQEYYDNQRKAISLSSAERGK